MKYRHILYPTDGSAAAKKAIPHIKALSKAFGSKITVLCVYHLPYSMATNYSFMSPEMFEQYKQDNYRHAKKVVDETIEELDARTLDIDGIVKEGNPKLIIPDFARQKSCDLIVMGTRGHTEMNYMGSTSTYVTHHSTGCPVLVID